MGGSWRDRCRWTSLEPLPNYRQVAPGKKIMAQDEREVRLARLEELRRVRDALAHSGAVKNDRSDDRRTILAAAWTLRRQGGGTAKTATGVAGSTFIWNVICS